MQIHVGETWGKKRNTGELVVYLVLKADRKGNLTLQNLSTPHSVFETDAQKLEMGNYFRVSETPYVNLNAKRSKKQKSHVKITRCPRTVDLFEGRADSEFPMLLAA
ncbi:MAG TPA: hypothetical protein VIE69_10685 [Methylophilaceae bacterium]|jgi:hypothetical protein